MLAAGAALVLANATLYPSALFDPVVILLALVTAFPKPGGGRRPRPLTLLVIVLVLGIAAVLGGSRYLHGAEVTTLTRVAGTDSVPTVLAHAWSWTGIVVVAAVCGAVVGWVRQPRRHRPGC